MTSEPESDQKGTGLGVPDAPDLPDVRSPGASTESEAAEPGPEPGPPTEPAPRIAWFRVLPGCLLAWAVPGLGHIVLGRFARGLALGSLVLALFVGGLWLDGKVYRPVEDEPLSYLAALGAAGAGVPFLLAHGTGRADGEITSPVHDYGNTFTLVAGLLNLLLVLDAFDVAIGRR